MESVLSVGIDIGTTTTSVVISRICFENTAGSYVTPKIDAIGKKIIHESDIYETPLLDEKHLDGEKIRKIVEGEYKIAGVKADEIESGAVIITGESLLKDNADIIAAQLSDFAGEFVVATAGPDLESVLAGKGAGAQEFSEENSCAVANIDIGGGTSNIAVFSCGDLIEATSADIGGRLLKYDEDHKITYISQRLEELWDEGEGRRIESGQTVNYEDLRELSESLADILFRIVDKDPGKGPALMITKGSSPLKSSIPVENISFSGGVADCLYKNERDLFKYGDIGVALAEAVRKNKGFKRKHIIKPERTIRATVVGAGIHTVTVSGSTIAYSEGLFPIKNLPVIIIEEAAEEKALKGDWTEIIKTAMESGGYTKHEKRAICIKGKKKISYGEICNLAKALAICADKFYDEDNPLIVVTEEDMAKALGQLIRRFQKKNNDIICVDKLKIPQGSYIDIGNPLMNGIALPVAVKTLIFK